MKHITCLAALVAVTGAALWLGCPTAAAEEVSDVPIVVATGTTQTEAPTETWGETEDGARCYYNAEGKRVVGIVEIDGVAYLFDYHGAQKTGWRTVNGIRQYFDPETGEPVSGWVEYGGKRYYADAENGKQLGELETEDGKSYALDETYGYQQLGFHTFSDGATRYYDSTGEAVTGLQEIGSKRYYFSEDGVMAQNQSVTADGKTYFADADGNLTDGDTPIMDTAQATAAQMTSYLRTVNPNVAQSVIDMIPYYLSEGAAEGVRGDVAFAQSCLETGNFTFAGSAVTLDQNNFCGLGVTSNGVKGNSFATAQLGIRAQIQHLKAYASTDDLRQACVDERFGYVYRGCAPVVEWLGAKENPEGVGWAYGAGYGSKILRILAEILRM